MESLKKEVKKSDTQKFPGEEPEIDENIEFPQDLSKEFTE